MQGFYGSQAHTRWEHEQQDQWAEEGEHYYEEAHGEETILGFFQTRALEIVCLFVVFLFVSFLRLRENATSWSDLIPIAVFLFGLYAFGFLTSGLFPSEADTAEDVAAIRPAQGKRVLSDINWHIDQIIEYDMTEMALEHQTVLEKRIVKPERLPKAAPAAAPTLTVEPPVQSATEVADLVKRLTIKEAEAVVVKAMKAEQSETMGESFVVSQPEMEEEPKSAPATPERVEPKLELPKAELPLALEAKVVSSHKPSVRMSYAEFEKRFAEAHETKTADVDPKWTAEEWANWMTRATAKANSARAASLTEEPAETSKAVLSLLTAASTESLSGESEILANKEWTMEKWAQWEADQQWDAEAWAKWEAEEQKKWEAKKWEAEQDWWKSAEQWHEKECPEQTMWWQKPTESRSEKERVSERSPERTERKILKAISFESAADDAECQAPLNRRKSSVRSLCLVDSLQLDDLATTQTSTASDGNQSSESLSTTTVSEPSSPATFTEDEGDWLEQMLAEAEQREETCAAPLKPLPPKQVGNPNHNGEIRTVWMDNFMQELMEMIAFIQAGYSVISMDTEFPGVVYGQSPQAGVPTDRTPEEVYQQVMDNVNALKPIQVGFTLSDKNGRRPPQSCWQFNLQFNYSKDIANEESLEMLTRAGLDWEGHRKRGIPAERFGKTCQLMGFNALLPELSWVCFHGIYDFGYLMKLLTGEDLPESMESFEELKEKHFPNIVDLKYALRRTYCGGLKGLASKYKVRQVGTLHQAGCDSIMTCDVYAALIKNGAKAANLWSDNVVWGIHKSSGSPRAQPQGLFVPSVWKTVQERLSKNSVAEFFLPKSVPAFKSRSSRIGAAARSYGAHGRSGVNNARMARHVRVKTAF